MRKLRRSSRSRVLFDELTMDTEEQALRQTIAAITQSDPLVKLLQQVRLGRMKPSDSGLLAVAEAWLATYKKAVTTEGFSMQALKRIDPAPRVAMLIDAGILGANHPAATVLQADFEQAVARASDEASPCGISGA